MIDDTFLNKTNLKTENCLWTTFSMNKVETEQIFFHVQAVVQSAVF